MSEELLSALLDGECTPAEVEAALAAIERSPALKARWTRMCMTRDAMAGVRIVKPAVDLTASIMAALDDQPEVATSSNVVPLRPRVAAPVPTQAPAAAVAVSARSLRWQRIAGLAVAASITAVVAIGGRNLLDQPVVDGGAVAEQQAALGASIVKVGANGEIVGQAPVDVASEDSPAWDQLDADSARQLNEYLIRHSSGGADAGMGVSLGYSRLVAQQTSYRPADGKR